MTHQQKLPRDPAPAGMREQVRVAASQAWRQPAEPIYLGRASRIMVQYAVPTLRRDGTVRGHQRIRQFCTQLPRVIFDVIYTVLIIPWLLIQFVISGLLSGILSLLLSNGDIDIGPYGLPRWKRRFKVKAAAPTGIAVAAGQGIARATGDVWLVVAPTATAVTQVVNGRQTVLWTQNGPTHLGFPNRESQVLRWPDQSKLVFSLSRNEARWLRAATSNAGRATSGPEIQP